MSQAQHPPQLLLQHHLKALKLPVFLREHPKLATQCAQDQVDYATFLLRLSELELLERERKGCERRIKQARFPANKALDNFDFSATPSLNKKQILELARGEWIDQKENVIFFRQSGLRQKSSCDGLGAGLPASGATRFAFSRPPVWSTLWSKPAMKRCCCGCRRNWPRCMS